MWFRTSIATLLLCLACVPGQAVEKTKPSVSKHDRKEAEQEFKRALDMQKSGQVQQALEAATRATEFDPGNGEYLTTREMLRQQIVGEYLERGNRFADAGNTEGAIALFSAAISMDPQNAYLKQRLRDVLPPDNPEKEHVLQLLASVDNINLAPNPAKKNIRAQGDTRSVFTQIGKLFDVSVQFDEGVSARFLHFDLDNVDFYTAMSIAGKMTKTFWAPVSAREIIIATDNAEKRKEYERLVVRTFYIGGAASATELTDLTNMLRTVFEIKFVALQPNKDTITLRGPREDVEAAASLLDNLMDARPEILLDLTAYEFDTDKQHNYGLILPNTFQVFNIPSEIRRVLGGAAQAVIDQLLATGVIDASKIPASSVSSLQSSPLLQPFVFFGKGQGLTGITVPPVHARLAYNDSTARSLEHLTMRAMDGEAATFRLGTRFPIVTSAFNAIAISAQGQTAVATTPSFTYADLGLTLKTTPHYHSDGAVRLDIDLEIQGLGTATLNAIPDLTTRSFKGNITVREGEPSVIAGLITDQEQRSTQGYPGIGQVPLVRSVMNINSRERAHNEILVVVTPHVIRKPFHDKGSSAIWTLSK